MIDLTVRSPEEEEFTGAATLPQHRTESRQAESDTTDEEVSALAYQLWVERGSPHGSHEEDWYQAEQQLGRGAKAFTTTA